MADTIPLAGRRPSGPEMVLQRFRVNRVNSLVPGSIPENGVLELQTNGGSSSPTSTRPTSRKGSTFSLRGVEDNGGSNYDTTRMNYDTKQSFVHFTREALPRMDNYRNAMSITAAHRPTMDELHDESTLNKHDDDQPDHEGQQQEAGAKFGWIEGVLVRCLLNIWGVMLFLRLSWMVAQCGIAESMAVIALATLITTLTTLSMSAISTNGEIKGGGIYYMISRSLGPEFGGAIGVVFSFANAANAALNTVGFSESLNDLLKNYFHTQIVDGAVNDIRITGSLALVLMQAVIFIGMAWEAKAQIGLLVILSVAMLDFFIGAFVGPMGNEQKIADGFVGLNGTVFMDNMWEGYITDEEGMKQDFFTVFSIFFPAVAGIQAGASISGDLRDPSSAIPKGTLWSIVITTLSYAGFALLAGAGAVRMSSGNATQVDDGEFLNCVNQTCKEGMYFNYQVMELMSLWGPLIYAGCFAATLSSALSCLVSCPKTFQALCRDRIYPYISIFGKGFRNDDPYWGYLLTFLIAWIFLVAGDLNTIAPLISNFFIASYALVNFCTFHASLVKPVGWRPTFKYYNMWLSLLGFLLCVAMMFLMSWVTALITFVIIIALFLYVIYRKPEVNWGSSGQAQTYKNAISSVHQLTNIGDHVKNFRPQILLLSGKPQSRPILVDFAYLLTKNLSLLICGHVSEETEYPRARNLAMQCAYQWLHHHKIKGFFSFVDSMNFEDGTRALIQSAGVGKLTPNIIMMGYKGNWQTCDREELGYYFNVLHNAFDNYMAVAILRVDGGLDYTGKIYEAEEMPHPLPDGVSNGHIANIPSVSNIVEMSRTESNLSQDSHGSDNTNSAPNSPISMRTSPDAKKAVEEKPKKKKKRAENFVYLSPDGSELPKETLSQITQFQRKQKKGTIDVWWLYDDGGLTLLLPYIINTRKNWSGCKLRVFALANKKAELELEQRSMASLLSKFRIDYSDLILIPDVTKRADEGSKKFFNEIIQDFRGISNMEDEMVITESELMVLREKTNRHLRLRELLMQYSRDANLIVMTLPMPRKGVVSAPLYMAWLEVLTRDMPPFLLVRGNQTSVLTFYS